MSTKQAAVKKRKVAWGITGGGDRIAEYVDVMEKVNREYANTVEIQVFLSKAGETVLKYYGSRTKFYDLESRLRENFSKVMVEINPNSPFLAAWMQMHKYEFLLIAPATSNTVAKIAYGIGDTMLTNAVSMSLKAFAPVYVVPTDFEEKILYTKLPNGGEMKLRIRKEDADNVRKLEQMDGMTALDSLQKIPDIFKQWFGPAKS
jgi:archaeoflavoprotein AfpA